MRDDQASGVRHYRGLLIQTFVLLFAYYVGSIAFAVILTIAPAGIARVPMLPFPQYVGLYAVSSLLLTPAVGVASALGGASPLVLGRLSALSLMSFGLGFIYSLVVYIVEPKH